MSSAAAIYKDPRIILYANWLHRAICSKNILSDSQSNFTFCMQVIRWVAIIPLLFDTNCEFVPCKCTIKWCQTMLWQQFSQQAGFTCSPGFHGIILASSHRLTIAWRRGTNEYLASASAYNIYNSAAMTSYLGNVAGPSMQQDLYSLIIHPISNIRSTWNGLFVSWCLQTVPWHVLAIENCQTDFAWPIPPPRSWEGYI